MRRRCIVLIFDALEYSLVERYDLKVFKQAIYGKVEVPLSPRFGEPATPQVIASFLTGKMQNKTMYFKEFGNPILDFLDKHITFQPLRNFAKMLIKGRKKPVRIKNTIFEKVKNSKAISVPCYNEEIDINDKMRYAYKNYSKEDKRFYEIMEEGFNHRKKELFQALNENYNLIVVHFYFLDLIQHKLREEYDKILKYYKKAGELVKEVKRKIGKNDLLIILSDHGQLAGSHTNYGFYSLNKKIDLGTPRISDFYYIIQYYLEGGVEAVRKNIPKREKEIKTKVEKRSEEEIKERLRKLGYFE